MTDVKSKLGYNSMCLTLVFMFGAVVGMVTVDFFHAPILRNLLVLLAATVAFHLTHRRSTRPAWLSKFFN